ncbi:putative E3 ubiquitin-protein ligase PRT1 [Cocos nucifera]|uniref:Putative E3 ubiquitin-protein ligase PRT1 n=1 Tax=Cocos nucifera TaxID=13894 RepID=A0A8K0N7A5_COCNU|nr:putative E3 ubiquitin-protein ligase PRT1 [Cocos nucifera]
MAGAEAGEAMDSSSPSASSAGDGTIIDDFSNSLFQCCVCLRLVDGGGQEFFPLNAGDEFSRFVDQNDPATSGIQVKAFLGMFQNKSFITTQVLHMQNFDHEGVSLQSVGISSTNPLFLLVVISLAFAYKRREKEVLEEEKRLDIYSPQFVDHLISERVHSGEIERNNDRLKANKNEASKGLTFPENKLENGICKQISMNDVLCFLCKELLHQPVVLNCGHVGDPLKCQVCQSLHPGEFPSICLDLDHFLEEQFPRESSTLNFGNRSA